MRFLRTLTVACAVSSIGLPALAQQPSEVPPAAPAAPGTPAAPDPPAAAPATSAAPTTLPAVPAAPAAAPTTLPAVPAAPTTLPAVPAAPTPAAAAPAAAAPAVAAPPAPPSAPAAPATKAAAADPFSPPAAPPARYACPEHPGVTADQPGQRCPYDSHPLIPVGQIEKATADKAAAGGHHGVHGPHGVGHGARGPKMFKVHGRVQAWYVPVLGEGARAVDLDAGNAPGFRLRRARLGAKGHATKKTLFGLELELADQVTGKTGVLDAWIRWAFQPALNVVMGVQRVPFSAGSDQSSARLSFPDRPHSILSFADFREAGLALDGKAGDGAVAWKIGAFNGSHGAFSDGDDNPGLMLAGRVHGGVGDIGKAEADLRRAGLRLRAGIGGYFNDASTNQQWGVAADLRVKLRGVALTLAYLRDHREPIEQPVATTDTHATADRSAVYAQLGYMVWPERLEAVFRLEQVDDNHALSDGGDLRLYTAGFAYWLDEERMKVHAAFVRKEELGGNKVDNDALILSAQVRF